MKKRGVLFSIMALLACLLTGCCISHEWQEAACDAPKTCAKCGKTEGEALGHDWQDATCAAPKTCARCGKTDGRRLAHTWQEATCEVPKTCAVCQKTEGKAQHELMVTGIYEDYYAEQCVLCGQENKVEKGFWETGEIFLPGTWKLAYIIIDGVAHPVEGERTLEFNVDGTCQASWLEEAGTWKNTGGLNLEEDKYSPIYYEVYGAAVEFMLGVDYPEDIWLETYNFIVVADDGQQIFAKVD